ncbi:MAG TPA: DUF2946 domain-containing protein [Dyella sp.]|uniref:DUF2946 domain-containing protein n=1 Tax=Dyella sp. TaxID=1869338 RepID=UPI002D767830|nr:DUF2946 domain-containing protein [Dyella sp.]HET6554192.1 DUF2946 domain-containing protein [Dyella sp.]
MLRRKAQRQLVTWLAWLAMGLLVVAPLISRVMPASASMHAMMGADCGHDMAVPSKSGGSPDATDRCGYCVLLGHQSLLAAHALLYFLPVPPRADVAVAYPAVRVASMPRFGARPRAPPQAA